MANPWMEKGVVWLSSPCHMSSSELISLGALFKLQEAAGAGANQLEFQGMGEIAFSTPEPASRLWPEIAVGKALKVIVSSYPCSGELLHSAPLPGSRPGFPSTGLTLGNSKAGKSFTRVRPSAECVPGRRLVAPHRGLVGSGKRLCSVSLGDPGWASFVSPTHWFCTSKSASLW